MWLFSQEGFVSAVKHKWMPGHLMVRARYEKDIKELAKRLEQHGCKATCKETTDADYRWRLTCTKKAYKAVMCDMVDDLDYTNFKDRIHEEGDKDRDHAYMGVWSDMHGFQRDKYYPKPKQIVGFGLKNQPFQSDNWNEQDWINWYHGLPSSSPNQGRVTYILEDGTEMIWDYDQDGMPEDWIDPDTDKPFDSSKWVIVDDDTPITGDTIFSEFPEGQTVAGLPDDPEEVNRLLGRGRYAAPSQGEADSWTDYLYGQNADYGDTPGKRGSTRGINAGGLLPIETQVDTTEESARLHELPPDNFEI
jgi:hypothetical protein